LVGFGFDASILSDAANQPPLILTIQGTLPFSPSAPFASIARALSPVVLVSKRLFCSSKTLELWEEADKRTLKWLYRAFTDQASPYAFSQNLSSRCYHLAGEGGVKAALSEVDRLLRSGKYSHVACSDAKHYYVSIQHTKLLELLRQHCSEPVLLDLLRQYCERTVIKDGYYAEVKKGIPACCALSPLMAALYLSPLYQAMEAMEKQAGVKYVRFMDDWVILAENRWKLRAAVKRMNQVLSELKLEQHPDKTFIERLDKEGRTFDFLGFDFTMEGLTDLSAKSCSRLTKKTAQIYDQASDEKLSQSATQAKVEQYRNRWLGWCRGILGGLSGNKQKQLLETIKERLCHHTTASNVKPNDPRPRVITKTIKYKNYVKKYKIRCSEESGGSWVCWGV
jgi:hypothetical protein